MVPNSSSPAKTCSFDGCAKNVKTRGLCQGHYMQKWKGKPLTPLVGKALTNGMTNLERLMFRVKKTKSCWNYTGSLVDGYGSFHYKNRTYLAHRASYEMQVGVIPEGKFLDHICHNRACVNPAHLRVVTNKQNIENIAGPHRDSKSGILGVGWDAAKDRWVARVMHHGITYDLGTFRDPAEAGEAARVKRLELFTHNDIDRRAS
ncbi:hypothetical protein CIK84_11205 [Glutamicibacter arilaitensis]|uniref:HNH nuclease domain-containing protein n=2 Tax=Glutamicibacter arilaitensis TaxID=256701 RepID=A0A2N7RZF2_9MICC|nr:hypothetical protein CIK84_11205 [Glutamicibacter arilaitensis]